MYNDILSVYAVVLGSAGTIAAIMSILKMSIRDIMYQRSAIGQDTSQLVVLKQQYDARIGTMWVVISGVIQIITTLWKAIGDIQFWCIFLVSLGAALISWGLFYAIYKIGNKKLKNGMPLEVRKNLQRNGND